MSKPNNESPSEKQFFAMAIAIFGIPFLFPDSLIAIFSYIAGTVALCLGVRTLTKKQYKEQP